MESALSSTERQQRQSTLTLAREQRLVDYVNTFDAIRADKVRALSFFSTPLAVHSNSIVLYHFLSIGVGVAPSALLCIRDVVEGGETFGR